MYIYPYHQPPNFKSSAPQMLGISQLMRPRFREAPPTYAGLGPKSKHQILSPKPWVRPPPPKVPAYNRGNLDIIQLLLGGTNLNPTAFKYLQSPQSRQKAFRAHQLLGIFCWNYSGPNGKSTACRSLWDIVAT